MAQACKKPLSGIIQRLMCCRTRQKKAPLAATMLRLRADYRRQTQFQRTIKKELSTMALYTPEYRPNGKEIAVIKTSKGDIRVQLAGDDAPIHVGNFV